MYVFPVLRWLKVFSQTWEGDVTMVLPSSFMQLKKSVTNPTNQDLLDACKEVRSWPVMLGAAMVRCCTGALRLWRCVQCTVRSGITWGNC